MVARTAMPKFHLCRPAANRLRTTRSLPPISREHSPSLPAVMPPHDLDVNQLCRFVPRAEFTGSLRIVVCGRQHIERVEHRPFFELLVAGRWKFARIICQQHVAGVVQFSAPPRPRSEEHTSELSHTVISYAVFCLKKKTKI